MLRTLWKPLNSDAGCEDSFQLMRVIISATMTRSMIKGEARRESSQTLKMLGWGVRVSWGVREQGGKGEGGKGKEKTYEIVWWPPKKISA